MGRSSYVATAEFKFHKKIAAVAHAPNFRTEKMFYNQPLPSSIDCR
jgi:hypothetical protein